jgi:triosephosphate isomerase
MKKALVIGNWKMNLDYVEAIHLVQQLGVLLRGQSHEKVEIAVTPPFVDLRSVTSVIEADRLPIAVGAQHVHHVESGAFTGEVSIAMLKKLGVKYTLVGHSERRAMFGMTDEIVRDTASAVTSSGVTAVICCGESSHDRENGATRDVLNHQISVALSGLNAKFAERVVIAYEPIWAIGTGAAATPDDIVDAVATIKEAIPHTWSSIPAVLYGGSVTPENCGGIIDDTPVDGFLVGGASLNSEAFAAIVASTNSCYRG